MPCVQELKNNILGLPFFMQISRYTFYYRNTHPRLLVNLLSEYEVEIEDGLFHALEKREFERIDEETIEELREIGVIQHAPENEWTQFLCQINENVPDEKELDITLCLTYQCNLKCSYCVQADILNNQDECIEEEYIVWIRNYIIKNKITKLHITFFGGEPLLRKNKISDLSREIMKICERHYVEFSFRITTNGTLLDPEDILKWKQHGLSCIDVTLDGPKALHDRNRRSKNDKGTYKEIIDNISSIEYQCGLNIICNIDPDNATAEQYIDFIDDFAHKKKINSFLLKPFYANGEERSCFFSDKHLEMMQKIWIEAKRKHLPVENSFSPGQCGFFNQGSFVIAPDGDIYPCSPFLGRKEFSLGNIRNGGDIVKKRKIMDNLPLKCINCTFCPICYGGCRFVSHKRIGDVAEPTCEKKLFSNLLVPL